ncbi:hypothetical protein NQZ68_031728 [Xyrichtys novacula]|uniref:Uncharacterized protein n=1 Tax=Xyrichtys novacula TaxID=13765 RepID=A0AAV1H6K9_XYRNO|nr:hypothetical protein NQZ68_031728 [Xyrichtys novacula]
MVKIFPFVTGKTLDSHMEFLQRLKQKGAKVVKSHEGAVVIVFCPIVSRYETDISAALSSASAQGHEQVILVALHPTFDKEYIVPNHGGFESRALRLLVDCLFHEDQGLLKCPRNDTAVEEVCKELRSESWNWNCCR